MSIPRLSDVKNLTHVLDRRSHGRSILGVVRANLLEEAGIVGAGPADVMRDGDMLRHSQPVAIRVSIFTLVVLPVNRASAPLQSGTHLTLRGQVRELVRAEVQIPQRGERPDLHGQVRELVRAELQPCQRSERPDLRGQVRELVRAELQLRQRGERPDLRGQVRESVRAEVQIPKRGERPDLRGQVRELIRAELQRC